MRGQGKCQHTVGRHDNTEQVSTKMWNEPVNVHFCPTLEHRETHLCREHLSENELEKRHNYIREVKHTHELERRKLVKQILDSRPCVNLLMQQQPRQHRIVPIVHRVVYEVLKPEGKQDMCSVAGQHAYCQHMCIKSEEHKPRGWHSSSDSSPLTPGLPFPGI